MRGALFVAFALVAHTAYAEPTKMQCIEADTHAQELRRAGNLHDALEQLSVCTNAACPEPVRADCSERADEIERVMPSVVFDVRTSSGVDVPDTRVEMDGRVVRERLDGRPVSVDPGDHTFVLTARGGSQTFHVLVHEGDKDRRVTMTVAEPIAPPPKPVPTSTRSAQRGVGLAVGATGLAGVALGAVFGGVAIAQHADVMRTCPNNVCPSSADLASVAAKNADSQALATASTFAFIAGAVLFAAGVVIYASAPRRTRVGLGPGFVLGTF